MDALEHMPAVALLGTRQVGKSSLALEISEAVIHKSVSYLDLELDTDLAKLDDPEGYLKTFENKQKNFENNYIYRYNAKCKNLVFTVG